MKKTILISFLFSCFFSKAQENSNSSFVELNYFYGNILEHSPSLKPLVEAHPTGFLINWNQKKLGNSEFEHRYNFPDFGLSASYQNFNTTTLGEVYSLYAHYNFYLTNRNSKNQVKLSNGFGLGYATNPFHKVTNPKNQAIGLEVVVSVFLRTTYSREYILDNFGINAGLVFLHYSNTGLKSPNSGINTLAVSAGINYNFDDWQKTPERIIEKSNQKFPIKFNAAFRTGFSESLINNSGIFPFYTISLFGTKKLSYKSIISGGTDLFFPVFMKDFIKHGMIQKGTPNETADWKRVGVFIGHELNMGKFSAITEIGVHAYYPYNYAGVLYERIGLRKRFNEHLFADLTLKVNLFRAEGLEFGIGYQF
ncbi:MAG: acyloxyacyl hydrolase [Flavobacteriaceae bacterium]|nr:acyloxyacyl hydrolase [Flavobacteriaceae bacterium]